MSGNLKIIGMTGSLRKGSYNRAALMAAADMLPSGVELEILDLADIPFFNEDTEAEGLPESVSRLRDKLAAADAVLFSVPEYNYSIPPVLKNALDWVSRGDNPPLWGKPAAIMSASLGMLGGARVQYHLRQVLTALNLNTLNKPEVFIGSAHTKFDNDGQIVDEKTKAAISGLVLALIENIKRKN